MRIFLCFVAVLMVICVGAPEGLTAKEYKFGVVDIQEVIDSVEEGKKARAQMESTMINRRKELEKKQREYKKLEESFGKQRLVLSPSALAEKQRELEEKKIELQKYYLQAQSEMQKKELSLTGDLLKKIRSVVSKIGQEGGYEVIWEKGDVWYYKDTFEVTSSVIEQYNRLYKKKKKK